MIAVYIVWGSTYLAIRFAVETMPPFYMAGTRFLIAGTFLYLVRRFVGDPKPTRVEWRSAAIVGLFLLLGGNGCVVWAEQRIPSGLAALIVGSTPLWMVIIDAVRPGGKLPTWKTTVGILVGFLGVLILFWPGGGGGSFDFTGSLVTVLGSILWAMGSLYGRGAALPKSPLLGTGMEMLAGGLGLLLTGTILGEWQTVSVASFSTRSLLGFAYLVIFGSLVGFAAYTWLLRAAPISLVSTFAYVNPLVAIALGFFLGNEVFSTRILFAGLMIISAVVLITMKGPARENASPADRLKTAPIEDA